MGKPPRVIKAVSAETIAPSRLRTFHITDVQEEARALVARARAEADAILAQARAEAAEIKTKTHSAAHDAGHRKGLEKGLSEGRAKGREEAFAAARKEFETQQQALIASCQKIITAINADREAWKMAAHRDLIELAMAIARRVVHHAGEEHRDVVLANLDQAVKLAGARTDVTLAVNPADADAARAFAKSLIDMREQWPHIRIVEEAEIAPGGCRVQWGSGSIDATLETQLDRIEAALRGPAAANVSDEGSA